MIDFFFCADPGYQWPTSAHSSPSDGAAAVAVADPALPAEEAWCGAAPAAATDTGADKDAVEEPPSAGAVQVQAGLGGG